MDKDVRYWKKQNEMAINFASDKHRGQMYGEFTYLKHLEDVYRTLLSHGCMMADGWSGPILVASWLHDIIEDTDVTIQQLKSMGFDQEVITLVDLVTNVQSSVFNSDKDTLKRLTYKKIKTRRKAITLKLADRVSNLQACILNNHRKLKKYREDDDNFRILYGLNYNDSLSSVTFSLWSTYFSLINEKPIKG